MADLAFSNDSKKPLLNKVTVIGLGLIGGSFAKGMKENGLCKEVVGFDIGVEVGQLAIQQKVVDKVINSLAEACVDADLIDRKSVV